MLRRIKLKYLICVTVDNLVVEQKKVSACKNSCKKVPLKEDLHHQKKNNLEMRPQNKLVMRKKFITSASEGDSDLMAWWSQKVESSHGESKRRNFFNYICKINIITRVVKKYRNSSRARESSCLRRQRTVDCLQFRFRLVQSSMETSHHSF